MSNNALIPTTSALDRLKRTTQRASLDELMEARTKRTILLVDVSSSMGSMTNAGERKIDALRNVVDTLRTTHHVPMAAFGIGGGAALVDTIPEPRGMTPLHLAIDFGRMQEANHLIVVTDGHPDSANLAFESADRFGGPIDVFYIGDGNDDGARFCAALAKRTGGQCGLTDLVGGSKLLAGRIQLLLGDGSEVRS